MEQYPALAPGATAGRVKGETVVGTLADSHLHTFNPVGGRIVELSDGSRTVAAVVEAITIEFEVDRVTAETDVRAFVEELVSRGVLVLSDAAVGPRHSTSKSA